MITRSGEHEKVVVVVIVILVIVVVIIVELSPPSLFIHLSFSGGEKLRRMRVVVGLSLLSGCHCCRVVVCVGLSFFFDFSNGKCSTMTT
jgi:hypothetical protein